MTATAWSQDAVLARVQTRLWRYLSAKAKPTELPAIVEGLFRLARGDLRRLAATHLALGPETRAMLTAAEELLRELPSSVFLAELESVGVLRGAPVWDRTVRRQWATGDPTRFVCRPAVRRYDTPMARLLALALRRAAGLAVEAGLDRSGTTGATIAQVSLDARRSLAHKKLAQVRVVDFVSERLLSEVEAHHHLGPIVAFLHAVREGVDELVPEVVEAIIGRELLRPAGDDKLFELLVGFELVDALQDSGFSQAKSMLVVGGEVPFARFHKGQTHLTLWWQRALWTLPEYHSVTGSFHDALLGAGLGQSSLRPDFLIVTENPRCVALVEAKQTGLKNKSPDRRGITEALAYLDDAAVVLGSLPLPHALVVGWNSKGTPAPGRIVVADEDNVGVGLRLILRSWGLLGLAALTRPPDEKWPRGGLRPACITDQSGKAQSG